MTEPLRILLLEDRAEDAELVTFELRKGGVDALYRRVETEEEFRTAVDQFAPDIILADYNLPRFDGLTALKILRERTADIPFIFVTGSIGEERAVEALREGATDYISKDRPTRLSAAVSRAIADAKAIAERRRVSRDLHLILESTSDGICMVDSAGNLTLVNEAAGAVLGRNADELLGMSVHTAFHSAPQNTIMHAAEECPIGTVVTSREPSEGEEDVFWRRDGTSVVVSYSASPIVDDHGIVVSFRDITHQKLLEAQLEQATRLSSLGRLSATIAHEVNNVLMTIQPFAEIVRNANEPERVTHAIDEIFKAIQRGKQITQEILRFTRPAEPSRTAIPVIEWLNSFSAEMRALLNSKIDLLVVPPSHPIEVLADGVQFHQVFVNLVMNARDAMPRGGTITIKAKRLEKHSTHAFGSVTEMDRYAHFIVSDTGEGMPRDVMKQIFDPLFTTKKSGTGIGLTVTHQIVKRHEGQIFVESAPGKGTTFHLFFPLATASSSERVAPRDAVIRARRLVLVEGDFSIASSVGSRLESEGVAVEVVNRALDAFPAIDEVKPDAVIVDFHLDDMSAEQMLAEISARWPELPIVLAVTAAEESRARELASSPRVTLLRKPYDVHSLLEILRALDARGSAQSAG